MKLVAQLGYQELSLNFDTLAMYFFINVHLCYQKMFNSIISLHISDTYHNEFSGLPEMWPGLPGLAVYGKSGIIGEVFAQEWLL